MNSEPIGRQSALETLTVALGARGYPIYIGSGLLDQGALLRRHIAGGSAMVVTNETVAPLYLDRLLEALGGLRVDHLILPDGEAFKTIQTMDRIYTALLGHRHDRGTTLVALGGGVVGDMTGFAAATYLRGVDFIQVPTTLLAQVDSSVGGKTGVNHPLGKNMIGAFHQPRCVLIDTDTLNTLEDRQLSAGLAEVIKYGLIDDPQFFAWQEAHLGELLDRAPAALAYAVRRSCEDKARVVAADETERSGHRALLNLGHTFGHAIETGAGYGTWLHGEAVGCGLVMAADLSCRLGWLGEADLQRIRALVERAGLPVRPPEGLTTDRFLELMAVDKKVLGGRLRLVLLRGIGRAVLTEDFDPALLRQTIDAFTAG